MFFDDWIIDEVVSDYMGELKNSPQDYLQDQFLKGAVTIAVEVRGARYNWAHAAQVYATAGRERGLDVETMQRLLNLAWHWTKAEVAHWTDLVRQWVCIGDHHQFYHVRSQQSLTPREFGGLFDRLSPADHCPIVPFLLGEDYLQCATHVAIMPSTKPKMHRAGEGPPVFVAATEPCLILTD